ncbi:hypothetical protein JOQ06_019040 [Pogonophryne albipinna]|uniref:Uncharacterized protein n=1 Tax=Pogonophryne albipinna TaxID=1090488 RepID=A0AAD6ASK6_9TELE|nr:hypothetical protein JOQ06_019040 [Pogonophryne albipinna]
MLLMYYIQDTSCKTKKCKPLRVGRDRPDKLQAFDPSFRIPEKGDRGAVIRRCRSAALQAARFLLGANSAVSGHLE